MEPLEPLESAKLVIVVLDLSVDGFTAVVFIPGNLTSGDPNSVGEKYQRIAFMVRIKFWISCQILKYIITKVEVNAKTGTTTSMTNLPPGTTPSSEARGIAITINTRMLYI